MQYEDPVGQEEARKTVPICELEEKALVSLAKVSVYFTTFVMFFSHRVFLVLFQCKMYFMILLLFTSISLSRFSLKKLWMHSMF